MQPHESEPYNPCIANVFYLAGYIETWGQGIKKICDSCRAIGAEVPTFELRGNGMRVHFAALQSAIIKMSQDSKVQNEPKSEPLDDSLENLLLNKVIAEMRKNPQITYDGLVSTIGVSRSSIKRTVLKLTEAKRIDRVGGKRYGHWEVLQ